MNTYIGIDIGGTKIEAQVFSIESNNTNSIPKSIWKKRIPTKRLNGSQQILDNINKLIEEILEYQKLSINDISGIGIGLPGSVSPVSKKMIRGNTAILVDLNIEKSIKTNFNCDIPISITNDANCFAYAEVMYGAGLIHKENSRYDKNSNLIGIGIILGTGLGGGVIINSKLLVGKNGGGAELGHTQFVQNGLPCYCKNHGCSEQYLSGSSIESSFNSRKYHSLENKIYSSQEIFELADKGEPLSIAVINEYRENLAKFLANLTNIFDPDFFVLGGGVSKQEIIYADLEDEISKQTFLKESRPKVYQNKLGDSSGALGAICEFFHV